MMYDVTICHNSPTSYFYYNATVSAKNEHEACEKVTKRIENDPFECVLYAEPTKCAEKQEMVATFRHKYYETTFNVVATVQDEAEAWEVVQEVLEEEDGQYFLEDMDIF